MGNAVSETQKGIEYEQLDQLTSINDLSMAIIEQRAKPIHDNTSDSVHWKFRSFDGFLGEKETLVGVLKSDWQTCLNELQVHPTSFAKELSILLQNVEEKRKQDERGPMAVIQIKHQVSPNFLINSKGKQVSFEPQELEVSHQLFNGFQYSLFWNTEKENSPYNSCWNEEYIITNLKLALTVKVAGNWQVGLVDYIGSMGFFEGGGIYNAYRVDPHILFAILTGKTNSKVLELLTQTFEWKSELIKKQIQTIQDNTMKAVASQSESPSKRKDLNLMEETVKKLTNELHELTQDFNEKKKLISE